ncbi:MAG: hypothetical protein UY07_C0011G0015 [Parcubacteria group bacterium GW2011_GWA1_47_8]|nr:MAG: hypothetical protein UY07_C0011G0015 [Parcubacteria group bacterium GW2011_GWA1_47_8]
MEQNTNTTGQNMNMGQPMNTDTPISEKPKSAGTTIGIIIIVLILAIGAFYLLQQVSSTKEDASATQSEEQASQAISAFSTQGPSTDMADIEKDLNATDFSSIDASASALAQ